MKIGTRVLRTILPMLCCVSILGQIDPEKRRLIQLGYNQPLEGRGPIAAYGFYYHNQPNFYSSNVTLRLAVAPIYLDTELGFSSVLTPNTDLALGAAGGGFADSYAEIRQGKYLKEESFTGHSVEASVSMYHRFNPSWLVPFFGVVRASFDRAYYHGDPDTHEDFAVPNDRTSYNLRSGLRFGGREPTLTAPLAMELSIWHELQVRTDTGVYGFNGDRALHSNSHLFWGRGLMRYTFEKSQQQLDGSLTMGGSSEADRFSAYRLGGVLPFASEFPLSIPGYYYQELTAERFALLNLSYSFPLEPSKNWSFNIFGAGAIVDYLETLEQPGHWHSGVGAGITYTSPRHAWFVTIVYGHGFNSIRSDGRGSNQVGLLFQYDFEAPKRGRPTRFDPGISPYRSRGGERLFK